MKPSRYILWSSGITAAVGLIFSVLFKYEKDPADSIPEVQPSQGSPSEVLQTSGKKVDQPHLPHSIIAESPYTQTSPDLIRSAKEKNELWAESYTISDTWTIQVGDGINPAELAKELDSEFLGPVSGFPDIFLIRFKGSEEESIAMKVRGLLETHKEISWFEQEIIETFALRYDESPPPFSDPLLPDQWHLRNVGDRWNVAGEDANIYPAWNQGVSGAGIFLAVVDTGTEGDHPDLAPNYRVDLDYDYLDDDNSAEPVDPNEVHGTSVAGVAAAAANDSCGVGAAFNAEIVGVRLIDENRGVSSSRQASAVSHRSDIIDIYNNSWGPDTEGGARMSGPGNLAFSAMKRSIQEGRGGLGSIYVWAGGNGLAIGGNVNYDGWAAHRYSIAVGSTGDHGKRSSYANPGAAMLICAHSNGDTSGIRTTDLAGLAGADEGDCRIEFGGTSSASPLVAGVVALMLEANPELNWRDVQHILAKTAVKVATTDPDWTRNGAGYWVNHYFGFGRLDAAAAVQVATEWISVGDEVRLTSGTTTLDQAIPDNSSAGIQAYHTENATIRVEHVAVTVNIDEAPGETADWGDLNITLTSPAGTKSILAEPHTDAQKSYPHWTYWSVRHLDETSNGTWILEVKDRRSGNKHIVKSWELEIFGTEIKEEDNHPPSAIPDEFVITDRTTLLDVLANDTDQDGDTLELLSVYRSATSTVKLLPSGLIEYTFGKGLNGRDRFGYTVHDGRGGIKTAEVRVTIPIPDAIDDQAATSVNTPVSIAVLNNDIDPDDDNFRLKSFTSPTHGEVEVDGIFSLKYTPEEGFIGVDRFSYSITDDKDGESEGEVTVVVTADDNYALLFDGDNDRIDIGNSANVHLNHPFTIEAWIRPTSWGEGETGYGRILDNGSVIFYLHGTGFQDYNKESLLLSLDHPNGGQSVHNSPAYSIKLNEWQHVAVTYDNISQVKLFINGVEQTASTPFGPSSGTVSTTSQGLIIGEAASNRRSFEGAIDEFRIWNRILPSAEINDRMFTELSGDETGLLIYYPMNEGSGRQLSDLKAPFQNGEIIEAKWIRGILSQNSPPISVSDEIQSAVGEKLIIPVVENDTDPDGDSIHVSRILNVSNGSASILGRSIIFQSEPGFTGLVRIDYQIDDSYNGTADSSLIIVVGEGLYYTVWETKYFAGSLGKAGEDTDFDTWTNFKEYAFGTDPLSADINPDLWNMQYDVDSGITTFTYTLLKESLDVNYRLLKSSNMTDWTVAKENEDYRLILIDEAGFDTETRTVEFYPENGRSLFIKIEAFSLAEAE